MMLGTTNIKLKKYNFMKIRPVAAELLNQTNGRTDGHDEVNSRFSQFCEKRLQTARV